VGASPRLPSRPAVWLEPTTGACRYPEWTTWRES
jgi:hypothetical protein